MGYTYIYIYIYGGQLQVVRGAGDLAKFVGGCCVSQSYIGKGISRQGIGSFVRISYGSTLYPVVFCPYLCTSECPTHKYVEDAEEDDDDDDVSKCTSKDIGRQGIGHSAET